MGSRVGMSQQLGLDIERGDFSFTTPSKIGQSQARNIHAYAGYLEEKTQSFRVIKKDFVHAKEEQTERFKTLTSDQAGALIEETTLIGQQINALLGCSVRRSRMIC